MIPNRIPEQAWGEFVKMRKALKKPMTEYAQKLMLGKLAKLMQQGQDAEAVLNQSILKGWTDIYEVKQEERQRMVSNGRPVLALVDLQRANSEAASRLLRGENNDNYDNDDGMVIDEQR